ncbi:MAG TPA: EthD family reductase [Trebonia sp.]|jgi:uncharacterized protein (TIGR02118 family)
MVRLTVLYNRPEDTAAFDKHYNEIHIPLAKKLPGLVRYTVSRNLRSEEYYLVAELDWEDMAALRTAMGSPAGAEATADVAKFATAGSSSLIYEVAEV